MQSRTASVLLAFAILAACAYCDGQREIKRTYVLMDTTVEIKVIGDDRDLMEEAVGGALAELKRIEAEYNYFSEDSVVDMINESAGLKPVKTDKETIRIIKESMRVSRLTGGAFDISYAPLRKLWDFKNPPDKLPPPAELGRALEVVGSDKIKVDERAGTVFLEKAGMRIDLGGVVKGYAVDRAIEELEKRGVKSALVNAGGDLRAIGGRRGKPWRIGIQDPVNKNRLIGRIELERGAVATSGDYERFFIMGDKRYSHIIDPRSGVPAALVRSVTVRSDTTMFADALATALFVLGPEEGIRLAESLEGVETMIIDDSGERYMTSGFEKDVKWFD